MSDATYKISAIAQVEGSVKIDISLKNEIIKHINKLSEETIKQIMHENGQEGRFFYNENADDIGKRVWENLPRGTRARYQAIANAEARRLAKGNDHTQLDLNLNTGNKFIDAFAETSYRRGGHLYVNGHRKY